MFAFGHAKFSAVDPSALVREARSPARHRGPGRITRAAEPQPVVKLRDPVTRCLVVIIGNRSGCLGDGELSCQADQRVRFKNPIAAFYRGSKVLVFQEPSPDLKDAGVARYLQPFSVGSSGRATRGDVAHDLVGQLERGYG